MSDGVLVLGVVMILAGGMWALMVIWDVRGGKHGR